MRQAEQYYEIISQILPQLEAKISSQFEKKYLQQIQKVKNTYQNCIQQIRLQHKVQISLLENKIFQSINSQQLSKNVQTQLRRQLSALQKQRMYWLKQQTQYIDMIANLVKNHKIQQNNQYQSKVYDQNKSVSQKDIKGQLYKISKQVYQDGKYTVNKTNQSKSNKKDQYQQQKNIFESYLGEKLQKDLNQTHQNNIKTFKKQLKCEINDQNVKQMIKNKQNHFSSILSPPKDQKSKNSQKSKKIFWNNQMKSKLRSFIKASK